jgi:hypothetical protein
MNQDNTSKIAFKILTICKNIYPTQDICLGFLDIGTIPIDNEA